MSFALGRWAKSLDLKRNKKLVMVCLAFCADDSGNATVATKMIADTCGIHERTARRLIIQLEEEGFIRVHNQADDTGIQIANRYEFPQFDNTEGKENASANVA